MSLKWQRSKRWDDEHIPAWAWPVRAVLRAFSSIWLAIVLLSGVLVFVVLASVPIGLLALAPTYAFYAVSIAVAAASVALAGVFPARWATRRSGRAARFTVVFAAGLAGCALGAAAWWTWVRPGLVYDPATGRGLRFFAGFVAANMTVTLRRLPAFEMTELEFYAWWPLRLILVLFVVNMVVATVRRIELVFVNAGVLAVHAGIVLIAMGSVYYSGLKQEGDTLLLAGTLDESGHPTPGPAQGMFYDSTRVALLVRQWGPWEQRPIIGLPRYNDHGLDAGDGVSASDLVSLTPRDPRPAGLKRLNLPLPVDSAGQVDPDLRFRIVGYAPYAEPDPEWMRAEFDPARGVRADFVPNPLRFAELLSSVPDTAGTQAGASQPGASQPGASAEPTPERPVYRFFFLPGMATHRLAESPAFAIEHTLGMGDERWADLSSDPPGAEGEPRPLHILVVETTGPEGPRRTVAGVRAGGAVEHEGWRVDVKELSPRPPFPIITPGYEDAQSSVAVVRVTPPEGPAFDRWIYHRYPELTQDLLEETNDRGMPVRRDADPAIRVAYIDATKLQVYLDERADGSVRALVRGPRGVATTDPVPGDGLVDLVPRLRLRLGDRWAHAVAADRPRVIPEAEREQSSVGSHDHAMIAVEVTTAPGAGASSGAAPPPSVVWVPFTRFADQLADPAAARALEREVVLPDGRKIWLGFGRLARSLPGFRLSLVDFTMLAYDHRGAPRDYQSVVRVEPAGESAFEAFEHVARLNAPLTAPFMWSDERGWLANAIGRVRAGLSPRQFKFSQVQWDSEGWQRTQQATDRGEAPRPTVRFTVLGVGNNPGIHVIALGGVLMSVGIPWAFYVKPAILRRRKSLIKRRLAREGHGAGKPELAVTAAPGAPSLPRGSVQAPAADGRSIAGANGRSGAVTRR